MEEADEHLDGSSASRRILLVEVEEFVLVRFEEDFILLVDAARRTRANSTSPPRR